MPTKDRRLAFVLANLTALGIAVCAHVWRALIDALSLEGISGCIMHDLVHIYCPLCGGTRAFVALCRGQLWQSLQYHPLALYFALGFLMFDGIALYRLIRRDERPLLAVPRWYWIVAIVIAAIVFVARNIALICLGLDNLGDLVAYWQ